MNEITITAPVAQLDRVVRLAAIGARVLEVVAESDHRESDARVVAAVAERVSAAWLAR